MSYTKGPWRWWKEVVLNRTNCLRFYIDSPTRKFMFTAEVWGFQDDPQGFAEVEANVRLAATSPLMHEALQTAADTLAHVQHFYTGAHPEEITEALTIVRRVLGKATTPTSTQPAPHPPTEEG